MSISATTASSPSMPSSRARAWPTTPLRSSSTASPWPRSAPGHFLSAAPRWPSARSSPARSSGGSAGWLMLRLRRWVRDPRIEITLSVLTPYLAFWPPQHLGGSGVLATVTVGLYMSWNGFRLISAATRLQGIFFWDFLVYLIEGMLFLITGLQARAVMGNIRHYSVSQLATSALVIIAVTIAARFIWMFPATYLPRWLIPAVRRA